MNNFYTILKMIAIIASSTIAQSGSNWTQVHPFLKEHFYSAIWTGEEYLAIGERGLIYSSKTGSEWGPTGFGPGVPILNIRRLNNKYFAAGLDGIYSSTDAANWKKKRSTNVPIFDIALNQTTLVAVGDSGIMLRSEDGDSWTTIASPTSKKLRSIIYALGAIYVSGDEIILKSSDLESWEVLAEKKQTSTYSIASNGTSLVAVGRMDPSFSLDSGRSWKPIMGSRGDIQNRVIWDGRRYIIAAWDGTINILSTDSTSQEYYLPSTGDLKAIASNGARYVVVGLNGSSAYSDNLTDWITTSPIQKGIFYAKKTWIILSDRDTYYTSANGTTWTANLAQLHWFSKITEFNGLFYAIGTYGPRYAPSYKATIFKSMDAKTWTIDTAFSGITFNDITEFQNELYVVGNKGTIARLSPAHKWETIRSGGNNYIYGAYSVNNKLFVCGDSLLVSTDGKKWDVSSITLSSGYFINSIIFTGSGYFASSGNRIFLSSDGMSWIPTGTSPYPSMYNLVWNGSEIIATSPSDMTISKSYNGIDWVPVFSGLSNDQHFMAYSGTSMIVIGRYGSIYLSNGMPVGVIRGKAPASQTAIRKFCINGSTMRCLNKALNLEPKFQPCCAN